MVKAGWVAGCHIQMRGLARIRLTVESGEEPMAHPTRRESIPAISVAAVQGGILLLPSFNLVLSPFLALIAQAKRSARGGSGGRCSSRST